jgi:hypothetical protein
MNSNAARARYTHDDSPEHDELRVEAFSIGSMMREQGLPSRFIARAVDLSEEFEGILDLMRLWRDESDTAEREEIVSDVQELIDDCAQVSKDQAAYIRFDDLERGGIGKLAELTHMPQPSISRFFNSASMPRRATLNKFARALNLSQVQIATPWSV